MLVWNSWPNILTVFSFHSQTKEEINKSEISDQAKFLADQKIDVLSSIN